MPEEFKAYAVFGGGGMRGAALAGALHAAQDLGIEFVGYAGVSAGSIIALLAAAGYTGDDLEEILKDPQTGFAQLLDDGGDDLYALGRTFRDIKTLSESEEFRAFRRARRHMNDYVAAWRFFQLYRSNKDLVDRAEKLLDPLVFGLGLYTGDPAVEYLRRLIIAKLPSLAGSDDISFKALREAANPDPRHQIKLKILASDLVTGRGVIFGDESKPDNDPVNASVLNAVRASIGYPFVFRPVSLGERFLVDGGVSSGLPVYIFEPEFQHTKIPIIAFELGDGQRDEKADPYTIYNYASDLLDATINASDATERITTEGIYPIHLDIPRKLEMHFRASQRTLHRMAVTGYDQAKAKLDQVIQLQPWAKERSDRLAGHVELLLYSLTQHILKDTELEDPRAYVMLKAAGGRREVRYSYGMGGDPDRNMSIGLEAGPSGLAWIKNDVAMTDLATFRAQGLPSNELPPTGQIGMISAPLREYWGTRGAVANSRLKRLGTVSLDFSAKPKGTESPMSVAWREYARKGKEIVAKWADIISVQLRYESLDDGG